MGGASSAPPPLNPRLIEINFDFSFIQFMDTPSVFFKRRNFDFSFKG